MKDSQRVALRIVNCGFSRGGVAGLPRAGRHQGQHRLFGFDATDVTSWVLMNVELPLNPVRQPS